jgi:hypothetical protein
VDANGFPLDAAGGNELTHGLSSFGISGGATGANAGASNAQPPAAVQGGVLRVLVTGRFAWMHWGTTTTPAWCHGVGTYDRLHPNTSDSKPLAHLAHNGSYFGSTVWQHPNASHASYSRASYSSVLTATAGLIDVNVFTNLAGVVGSGDALPDLLWNGVYVGSRFHIARYSGGAANGPVSGGAATTVNTAGHSIGLAPDDFLLFARKASVATGDTITVNGKLYEHVSTGGYAYPGLFINTQPLV